MSETYFTQVRVPGVQNPVSIEDGLYEIVKDDQVAMRILGAQVNDFVQFTMPMNDYDVETNPTRVESHPFEIGVIPETSQKVRGMVTLSPRARVRVVRYREEPISPVATAMEIVIAGAKCVLSPTVHSFVMASGLAKQELEGAVMHFADQLGQPGANTAESETLDNEEEDILHVLIRARDSLIQVEDLQI